MLNFKDIFKSREPLVFFLLVFFLVCPGATFLFIWHRELFLELEWVKLCILSASMTVPFVLINSIIQLEFEKTEPSKSGKELVDAFVLNALFVGITFYAGLLISYLLNTTVINTLLICEVIAAITVRVDSKIRAKTGPKQLN